MTWPERVATALSAAVGEDVAVEEGFGPCEARVPPARWADALQAARDSLGCGFFDWLSAVDELDAGFRCVAHVAAPTSPGVDHLLVSTRVAREAPRLPSVVDVYAGAAWHERETHEMFGIEFIDGPAEPLLLPDGFEGYPLRKEFVLASRVAKPWPGAKEPGESEHDAAPSRRRTRPPGVPDPREWGPREPGEPDA